MDTAAKIAELADRLFCSSECQVVASAAVSMYIERKRCKEVSCRRGKCDSRVKKQTNMNPYDKLEHEQRAWSVCEAAAFLGYSVKHVYKLIHQGKIEGWIQVEGGGYKFCPVKLKAWMEKRFNSDGRPSGSDGSSAKKVRKEDDHEARI